MDLGRVSRYHRQSILPGFGPRSEAALAGGHVMVIGIGALGCPAADLLVRAGVGRLTLVDRDTVELTNLQRQSLFAESDVGRAKAEAAADRLGRVNSQVRIEALCEDFSPASASALMAAHPRPGVVLDCTDNFQTRYLINDACVKHGVPLVYGGAVGTQGVQMTLLSPAADGSAGPCLRCLFPDAPLPEAVQTCETSGVLAPVATIVGAAQATDAIKLLVDPAALSWTMLRFDPWLNQRTRIDLRAAKDPECPCCAEMRFDYLSMDVEATILCGRNAVQVPGCPGRRIDLAELASRLEGAGRFAVQRGTVLSGSLHDGTPLTVYGDGRSIVGNTTDPARARAIVARVFG